MRFGDVPIDEAEGAILAHSIALETGRLRKGIVLSLDDIAALRALNVSEVTVAQPETTDVLEDAAAEHLAHALVPDEDHACLDIGPAFTGRVNLIARGPGVVEINEAAIAELNQIHPMITCATVLPYTRMEAKGLVATIKIIAYAVPKEALDRACAAAHSALSLRPVTLKTADLILTDTGSGPDNSKGILAVKGRLTALGMEMARTRVVAHKAQEIAAEIAASQSDLVLILTASATSDLSDTAPSALRIAGGQVTRFGMPVDPGNLLFLGDLDGKPVIGLPGCARSPALNGADWVLERIACGVPMTSEDIGNMGVGGLLKEIPQRPQPRRGKRAE